MKPEKKNLSFHVGELPLQINVMDSNGNSVAYVLRPAGKKLGACLNKLELPQNSSRIQ